MYMSQYRSVDPVVRLQIVITSELTRDIPPSLDIYAISDKDISRKTSRLFRTRRKTRIPRILKKECTTSFTSFASNIHVTKGFTFSLKLFQTFLYSSLSISFCLVQQLLCNICGSSHNPQSILQLLPLCKLLTKNF